MRNVETDEGARFLACRVRSGCPCHYGDDELDARDALESLIRRGGRRGRRLGAVVAALDERFLDATMPTTQVVTLGRWWRARYLV